MLLYIKSISMLFLSSIRLLIARFIKREELDMFSARCPPLLCRVNMLRACLLVPLLY